MTDTKALRKLAEAAALIDHNERAEWYSEESMVTYAFFPKNARFIAACTPQTVIALLDTIEAQAAEIERQNATIDSYINTAAVLAAKVEAQSAEIERLKASFTNELDSLSNRNYQLRMANADQSALLKRCKEAMGWHYRCTDCTDELAAIDQWENGK